MEALGGQAPFFFALWEGGSDVLLYVCTLLSKVGSVRVCGVSFFFFGFCFRLAALIRLDGKSF